MKISAYADVWNPYTMIDTGCVARGCCSSRPSPTPRPVVLTDRVSVDFAYWTRGRILRNNSNTDIGWFVALGIVDSRTLEQVRVRLPSVTT